MWDVDTGKVLCVIRTQSKYERGIVFGPDSQSVVGIGTDFVTPIAWDPHTGKELRRVSPTDGQDRLSLSHEL